ncbi:ComF family protein [Niabella drilacis]|uniref:ComF family protein n=1 Tax=Niabella drilacis (strain DSM 25811 / CCM 8410 / CCUG 62505 / LMG 26954 / E90) TaxID=1285928 RepID=A0A1G7BTH3_NIADE|nr:ComF family protein [Niabella drilacis]SDE30262.1 comF family protein [Niabella drilacis]
MNTLQRFWGAFSHLFYPHVCAGCGSDALPQSSALCLSCLYELPATGFEDHADNPVEKIFAGRLRVEAACAHYYFSKQSPMQHILHQVKYGGNRELAHQLGVTLGAALKRSPRFSTVDLLVPMPLFITRERERGYNQAGILCSGIAAVIGRPVCTRLVYRSKATATQTKKNRIDRWNNMQGKFSVPDDTPAANRHLLLVDDVVTTGATLEACGSVLLRIPGVKLSIAVLCFASD